MFFVRLIKLSVTFLIFLVVRCWFRKTVLLVSHGIIIANSQCSKYVCDAFSSVFWILPLALGWHLASIMPCASARRRYKFDPRKLKVFRKKLRGTAEKNWACRFHHCDDSDIEQEELAEIRSLESESEALKSEARRRKIALEEKLLVEEAALQAEVLKSGATEPKRKRMRQITYLVMQLQLDSELCLGSVPKRDSGVAIADGC